MYIGLHALFVSRSFYFLDVVKGPDKTVEAEKGRTCSSGGWLQDRVPVRYISESEHRFGEETILNPHHEHPTDI